MDWFLYDGDLRHERVNLVPKDALGMRLFNFVDLPASIPPENFTEFLVKQTDIKV